MLSTKADLETNFSDMIKLGEIFGVKPKAEEWVADQRKTLAAIQNKLKDLPRKRVFIYDSEDGQPFTAFEGYTTNILKLIGADNVMSGLGVDKTWAKGSWETVIAQNPDYIIIADYGNSIRNDDDFQQKIEDANKNSGGLNPQEAQKTAIDEVNATIKEVAKAKGYTLILQPQIALYAEDESKDITEAVLDAIKAKHPEIKLPEQKVDAPKADATKTEQAKPEEAKK